MADATASIGGLLAARADDDHPGLRADDAEWTWAEVVVESAARADLLDELGLTARHIGVLLPNVPEFVFLLGAAALSGSVVVGINPTRRGDELARDIRHTDCAVVLTDAAQSSLLEGLDLGGAEVRVVDGSAWTTLVGAHRGAAVPVELPPPDALYLLLFTSGSTGAPKAVQMSQGRAARTAANAAMGFTADSVLYCAMPLFHGNALLANLFPGLVSGATVVLRPRFSASAFLDDVRRHRCTYFNYVGRALSYILAQPETPDDADNQLQWCLGSEASPTDRRAFRKRFGCPVMEGYSSSEGAVVIQPFAGMPPDALGRPNEGSDVVVLDPESGAECPPARFGEGRALRNAAEAIGEIVGRDGLSSFEGYYANPEATAERGRDGWYWSGDLGYRDEDGTFYFAGRTADWLRVDGENFAAGPVEAVLARYPGVAGAVVYGVPDPRTGDQVMAALELPADAFDPEAFAAFLAGQARPRHQVGAPLRPAGRGHPAHGHREGGPQAAAGRAVGHPGPDLVASHHGCALSPPRCRRRRCPAPRLRRRWPRGDAHVRFAVTHPLVTHPYHPELISGAGIGRVAAAAEAAGFSGFGFTDHPAPSQRWLEGGGHDALDPFVAMGYAAAHTTTLRMIPNIVVLPYRNPFAVAKAGATLDVLSGGRFTLAVGAGYLKSEFAALGVDHAERNELFDEAIDVIKAIWTGDDVTFEGRHFSARGVTAHPRPTSHPHPPIWIGGNSGGARQRVADRGDGWCPFPAPPIVARTARTVVLDSAERLAEAIDDLRRRLETVGRDPASIDISFSSAAGGDPASDAFDAGAHLEGLAALERLGVTWTQVGLPGDSVEHAVETLQRYGEHVISCI